MTLTTRPLLALIFAAAVLLAACASSGSAKSGSAATTTSVPPATTTTAVQPATTTAPTAAAAVVTVTTTPLGLTLVDASGHTLYQYQPDPKGSSTCTGQCATIWPPLTASGTTVTVGPNLPATQFSTITGTGGIHIVTDAGHPLYRYSGDKKAGDTNGEGIGGVWHAAGPVGNTM